MGGNTRQQWAARRGGVFMLLMALVATLVATPGRADTPL